jgi:hypothetical protein
MSQRRQALTDPTEATAVVSSPVSPTSRSAPFAGSSQDQANERASTAGVWRDSDLVDIAGSGLWPSPDGRFLIGVIT